MSVAAWCRAALRGAVLLLTGVLLLARPAAAQGFGPLTIGNNTFTNSTTMETTVTNVTQPGVTVVAPGFGPLNNELTSLLAGPNGALIAKALSQTGVLGPATLTPQGTVAVGTNTTTTTTTTFGPGTVMFGPGESQTFIVGAGDTEFNSNTDTHVFEDALFQSSQSLSPRGVNWLLGDLHTEFQTAILDGDFDFVDGLLSRARGGEGPGMLFSANPLQLADAALSDAPAATTGPWRLWVKGDYASAGFAGTASNFGFGYSAGGGELGLDYRSGELLLGGAFAYDHADVTQDTTGDTGGIGSWRLGGYASWQPGPWSFTGILAGGFHDISGNRLTLFPAPSASSYSARSFDVAGEAAREFPLGMATLQPMAGLVYTDLNIDGFNETGGLLNLNGQSADIAALRGYAGARLYQSFDLANGMALTPEVRARVLYDFLNDQRAFTATFAADPTQTQFLVTGLQPDRLAGLFGVGASLQLTPQWRGFVSYDAELRGGDLAHFVTAGLKLSW